MPSIFDFVKSEDLVAYWNTMNLQETDALLGEELFPSQQKLGLDLKWVKGSMGLPVVLKPSAYDVAAFKRDRIGFDKVATEMPFFKEGVDIDEELRQQLNMVIETGNQVYIDAVLNRVFDDEMRLLRGARAQRERMRMSLITTGGISISANGQNYEYDYGLKDYQQKNASIAWSNPSADIMGDIESWQDAVEENTGTRPDRAIISSKTKGYILKNKPILNSIWGQDFANPPSINWSKVKNFVESELGLTIAVYTKKYVDEAGATKKYMPDDLFSLIPSGTLGTGWFGTTPEQSDLMTGSAANVSITDTGVAVTTSKKIDPVNVETKVSMIYLPSFEQIDKILIADLTA